MLFFLLDGLILVVLLWFVTSGSVEIDYWKMVGISFGVALVGGFAGAAVGGGLAALLVLVPVVGVLVFLLMAFCYCTLQQALLVAGLYLATHIGLSLAFQAMFAA